MAREKPKVIHRRWTPEEIEAWERQNAVEQEGRLKVVEILSEQRKRENEALLPLAKRGADDLRKRTEAGRAKKGSVKVDDETLKEELKKLRRTARPEVSWSAACEKVAKNVGYEAGETVRRRIPEMREWWESNKSKKPLKKK